MDGKEFARIIESALASKGIAKGEFYAATGISPTALYGWKRGAEPSQKNVEIVEKYLGINVIESAGSDTDGLREYLREDLRILLRSASDLPPSSVYQLISQIEKEKENAN